MSSLGQTRSGGKTVAFLQRVRISLESVRRLLDYHKSLLGRGLVRGQDITATTSLGEEDGLCHTISVVRVKSGLGSRRHRRPREKEEKRRKKRVLLLARAGLSSYLYSPMYHVHQFVYVRGIHTTTLYYGSTNIDPALCISRSEAQENSSALQHSD